jgi:hypothetical protein
MKSVSSMRFCGPSSHRPSIRLGGQHSGYRWMNEAELRTATDVHENTEHHFAENC